MPSEDSGSNSVEPWLEAVARTDLALAPGMLVTERVRLDKPLGEGGMGVVWSATHLTLEQEVAVKFVRGSGDSAARRRFEREAKLAAKIKSPHAVRIFDHGVTGDGSPFIVMERLEGESLAQRLARGPLPAADVARMVEQVALVLSEAHELGVIHRDIKPSNLFLVDDAYDVFVKVLDFGVAKRAASDDTAITRTGALVGTPRYMSPEQLLDGDDGAASADLWALAIVAYESLTGRCPFEGITSAAIGAAVSRGDFALPSALDEGFPAAVDDWFVRAFRRDVALRHASAEDLAQSLARALDGTPRDSSGAQSMAVVEKPSAAPRRVAIGIALAALLGAVGWLVFADRGSAPTAPTQTAAPTPSVASTPEPSPPLEDQPPIPQTSAAPMPTPVRRPIGPAPSAAPDTPASGAAVPPPPPSAAAPKPKQGLIKDIPF